MRARIGVAETGKVVEVEVEDDAAFRSQIDSAVDAGSMVWLTDAKGRTVGVPGKRVAYVEFEDAGGDSRVGFVPS